jgi:hypothetical protein
MEIIKKAASGPHKFKTSRPFMWGGKKNQIGDEVELKEPEATAMVKAGRVIPDLKETDVYVTLRPFTLPGASSKFECKALELVSLKSGDALKLMLDRACLPLDDQVWRPYHMKLSGKRSGDTRKELDELDRAAFQQKVLAMGLPSQKGGRK